jgi:hypothetical protein
MLWGMAPCIERAIAERARTQLGHITDQQMAELAVSPKVRRRLLTSGWFEKVGWHTYRMAGAPPTFEAKVMAACLDVGAVASHRTAAVLHGLAVPRAWRAAPIEVTTEKRRRHASTPLAVVHSSTNLGVDDIVHVRGVPTTSVARTVLGLAALVPRVDARDVRTAVDAAVRDGKASDRWLWWRLEELRCRGRDGVGEMEALLADRAGRGPTESWLEYEFLELNAGRGFPRPIVQRRVRHRGAFVARVDFLFGDRLVVEVSGRAGYVTDDDRAAQAERRNRLQLAGYDVIEFTYKMIVETPWLVLAQLAQHLAVA